MHGQQNIKIHDVISTSWYKIAIYIPAILSLYVSAFLHSAVRLVINSVFSFAFIN